MGLPRNWATSMSSTKEPPVFFEPLRSISPTTFSAIKQCALNVVWQRNGIPPLLPASPKARVGTISHRLLAEAGQSKLGAEEATINARWHELVAETNMSISSSPLEQHLAPLENSVPDIEVRRIRATRNALVIAGKARSVPRDNGGPIPPARYGHEIPVQSTDGLVRGTIDAVVQDAGSSVNIRDYKSGAVLESSSGREGQLKESYQTQLKMYAQLYAETFGEWPASLEIVSLAGESQKVPFTKSDCSNLLNNAKASLRLVNENITNHPSNSLPAILANPSPQACGFCQYRPACGPYRSAAAMSDLGRWPLDVIGTVESVQQLGNFKMMLEIATSANSVKIPGLSPGNRHPVLQHLQPGDLAGTFNLRRSRPTGPYSESQLTTVHRMEEVH